MEKNYVEGENGELVFSENPDHVAQVQQMLKDSGQEANFKIILAEDNVLQIDIDDFEHLQMFNNRIPLLKANNIEIEKIFFTRSKSWRWHVFVRLKEPLKVVERILLQTLLGSDPNREFMNYVNVKKGDKNPILLLERVEEWENPAHLNLYNLKVELFKKGADNHV